LGCGSGGGFPDAPPDRAVLGGTLSLAWSLQDTAGRPLTCEQIGAAFVVLYPRNRGVEGVNAEVMSCAGYAGTTPALRPGTYDVNYELTSASGMTLALLPAQMGLAVEEARDTTLAPIVFTIDARGMLDLHITANKPGGNCTPTSAMGAGITAHTITLVHAVGGGCEPITIAIAAGATKPAGSYVVNCASPMVAACIESDQRLTATGVRSDSYVIHVRGKIGATDCYVNDDSFSVPPLGMSFVRTLNLSKLTAPGC
jgi:hypothetical protein